MCGIAGIVAPDVSRHRPALERMVAALGHRGPDGSGAHLFPGCGLGHTRLNIVDLLTGDQPMFSPDGNTAITFNGEIYGYREIRKRLDDRYHFHTSSDTEVILALYQLHGRNLLQHLPGMFSFAIWDEREQTLFAARDRFGEKPFYYAWGPQGEFLFASEIKSLIASGLIKPRLNKAALVHYLRHLYVHPRQTIYTNIHVLPPAHFLSLRNGQLSVERYWELPELREPLSEQDALDEFRRLFEKAVERQLVADVPVGTFLSGGLDSSSVVAAASRTHSQLKTFSFGFLDSVNELPYAKEIAELYGTEHTELADQRVNIGDLLREMARVYDEPFADSSNIPMYLISQAARRYVKVVLTGDGGDELLAGYDYWYRPLWDMERSQPQPGKTLQLLRLTNNILGKFHLPRPGGLSRLTRDAGMSGDYQSITRAHTAQNVYFDADELHQLGLDGGDEISANGTGTPTGTVDDALRMDLNNYMPGDILVKTDRASMAHGLELRAPFLDVDFASFCISLPSRLKINAEEDKWILRRCYSESWTETIRKRRKCGFGAPVAQWLERESVANLKESVLGDPGHPLFSLLPFDVSRQFTVKNDYKTWILLTLGLWFEHAAGEVSL